MLIKNRIIWNKIEFFKKLIKKQERRKQDKIEFFKKLIKKQERRKQDKIEFFKKS